MSSGKLVLFSGPSGVGKDTLLEVLTKKRPALQRSISLTTRQRRNGEKDGVDYFFVTPEHFQELLSAGDILEFAQYGKNLYGTPKKPVDEWLREGKTVILKIEVQGAEKIKHIYPQALSVFILPPSMEVLERRLRDRGTEDEEDLARRMRIACDEIRKSENYDYRIVNDSLERAADEFLTFWIQLQYNKVRDSYV